MIHLNFNSEGYFEFLTVLAGFLLSGAASGWALFQISVIVLNLKPRDRLRRSQVFLHCFADFMERYAQGAMAPVPPDGVLILIPAFNEGKNIESVLARIPKRIQNHAIQALVIDDGSADETAEVALRQGAWIVKKAINLGIGHSLSVGFQIAQALKISYVVLMDADGQHRPEDLSVILDPLFRKEADLVVGSRKLGSAQGQTVFRGAGISFFSRVLSLISGSEITDCSSGYRGLSGDLVKSISLIQPKHFSVEMIVEALRCGARIKEAPINVLSRLEGKSKQGPDWRYGLRYSLVFIFTLLNLRRFLSDSFVERELTG
jgi:glycosyltransferase involved in cell wall biosynthesis